MRSHRTREKILSPTEHGFAFFRTLPVTLFALEPKVRLFATSRVLRPTFELYTAASARDSLVANVRSCLAAIAADASLHSRRSLPPTSARNLWSCETEAMPLG